MRAIDAAFLKALAQSGAPSIVEPLAPLLAKKLPAAHIGLTGFHGG